MRRDKYNVSFRVSVGNFLREKFFPLFELVGRQIKSTRLIFRCGKKIRRGVDIKKRNDNIVDFDKQRARGFVEIFSRAAMKNACAVKIIVLLK